MLETSKIRRSPTISSSNDEAVRQQGITLPAVKVAQLAKFHTKAKKGSDEKVDPHAEGAKAFELVTQRKVDEGNSDKDMRQSITPFRPR